MLQCLRRRCCKIKRGSAVDDVGSRPTALNQARPPPQAAAARQAAVERQAAAAKEASEVEQNVSWLEVVLVHLFLRFEEAVGLRGFVSLDARLQCTGLWWRFAWCLNSFSPPEDCGREGRNPQLLPKHEGRGVSEVLLSHCCCCRDQSRAQKVD